MGELAVNRDTGKKHQEAPSEKLVRKFKENPFLPIGCGATTFFLVNGLFKFGRKDSEGSQKMMREELWRKDLPSWPCSQASLSRCGKTPGSRHHLIQMASC